MKREIIGIVGQYSSMIAVTIGIVVETITAAHIGFILITVGGLLWGISTKIRGK